MTSSPCTFRSSDKNDIPYFILRYAAQYISEPPTCLINLSYEEGHFSDELKSVTAIPVAKNSSVLLLEKLYQYGSNHFQILSDGMTIKQSLRLNINKAKSCVKEMMDWCASNSLILNSQKTSFVVFSSDGEKYDCSLLLKGLFSNKSL